MSMDQLIQSATLKRSRPRFAAILIFSRNQIRDGDSGSLSHSTHLLPPRPAAAAARGPADALQARWRPRKARRRRRPRPHACIRRPRSRRAGPRPAGPRPGPDRRGGESPTPLACRICACRICDQDIPDNIARKNRVTAIRQTRGRKHSSWAHCLYMDVTTHCFYIHARASEHASTQRRHRQCQRHRA
jgi:hypothetical protein